MTAIVVARLTVKDADKLQEYLANVGATVSAFGGKVIMRGAFAAALLGESAPHKTGILEFPDIDTVNSWFNSADYQALADVRDAGCDMELLAYEVPAT